MRVPAKLRPGGILPALILFTAILVSACGPTATGPSATPTATGTPSAAASTTPTPTPAPAAVHIYLVRDGKVGATERTIAGGSGTDGAINALLNASLIPADESAQLKVDIPAGTKLLSSSLSNDVLTVNLSTEILGGANANIGTRLAEVVYTATQFPENQRVNILIAGKAATSYAGVPAVYGSAVSRADLEDFTPAILVEEPTPGDHVTSPIHIYGTANVFEAQFNVGVMSPGAVIMCEQPVTASSGTGTRGTFDVSLTCTATGSVNVLAWDVSMRDGSRMHEVYIPLQLG